MKILLVGLALILFAAFIYSLIWAYADARLRNRPAWLVVLMVILLPWPSGLIVWVLIRPEEPAHAAHPR